MRYALFLGCKIPYYVPHYETATRSVLSELGVKLVDIEFNCCGHPMRHLYFNSYILAAARAMAIAEKHGIDILTPCKCCFGSFKRCAYRISTDCQLKKRVNDCLAQEGLVYNGHHEVRHLYSALYHDVGLEAIKDRVKTPFSNLNVAVLYGCHALRPSCMTQFDNPYAPSIIDKLVNLTGANSIDWPGRLLCCGSQLRDFNDTISMRMIKARLTESRKAGADVFVIGCPYSNMQSEWAYLATGSSGHDSLVTGTLLYPQLLGLSMGLSWEQLGLDKHIPDPSYLLSFLKKRPEGSLFHQDSRFSRISKTV